MKSFVQIITEELALSQVRPYMDRFVRDRYNDIFNNKYRIYLPYESIFGAKANPNKKIVNYLDSIGYNI